MKARGKAASQKVHQMGGDETPVVIWPLDRCRANSETGPLFIWRRFVYLEVALFEREE